ncbi:Zinc finger, PHD-type domain containing protein [Quillaja saponaria]|uniref:Zinc finger, PHD-type domain containing protein n=1 Tax=Quillaja saponaria TaxID=32244 RepID=A0AAD7KX56_QUISA|nr:Zinc finger, PHD-type domain containing protein [Quillaja saponaria]
MDTVVEDDSGDYYCSLCQEERDPRSQVYYCADCKYIADLTCVIFEVLNILRGDCKDVHFRALGEPEIMVQDSAATSNAKAEVQIKALDSLTLRGIMNTLSEEDEKRLKEFLAHPREVPHELGMSDEISPYTEKNFNQLKERLFPGNLVQEKRITPYELQQKVVIVEGYMIPWNLAPILKDLFSKYGDISNESKLSSVLKGIGFFYLCRVIRSMLATRVTYATEDLLGHWFYVLNVVQRMGFKVDFAMDRLKRVTQAYFGFQASRRDNDILCFIDERKKSLSRELDELKEKLEHFEKHYQQHDTYLRSTKSSFIKECLKDASKLDWKFVGETLL